ncbi:hypothetical protein [Streptomyces canus]
MLADNLQALGHDIGLEATGTLDLGRVTVLPGGVRVGALKAGLGDPCR